MENEISITQALNKLQSWLNAGDYERVIQGSQEILSLEPGNARALALMRHATERRHETEKTNIQNTSITPNPMNDQNDPKQENPMDTSSQAVPMDQSGSDQSLAQQDAGTPVYKIEVPDSGDITAPTGVENSTQDSMSPAQVEAQAPVHEIQMPSNESSVEPLQTETANPTPVAEADSLHNLEVESIPTAEGLQAAPQEQVQQVAESTSQLESTQESTETTVETPAETPEKEPLEVEPIPEAVEINPEIKDPETITTPPISPLINMDGGPEPEPEPEPEKAAVPEATVPQEPVEDPNSLAAKMKAGRKEKKKNFTAMIIAALIVVLIGGGLIWYLKERNRTDVIDDLSNNNDQVSEQVTVEQENTQRENDLNAIAETLENYKEENGVYPSAAQVIAVLQNTSDDESIPQDPRHGEKDNNAEFYTYAYAVYELDGEEFAAYVLSAMNEKDGNQGMAWALSSTEEDLEDYRDFYAENVMILGPELDLPEQVEPDGDDDSDNSLDGEEDEDKIRRPSNES